MVADSLKRTHAQVFVWVGRASDTSQQKAAQKKAQQLGQRDGRAANTPVTLVQPGKEPPLFTAAFPSWNASQALQVSALCHMAYSVLANQFAHAPGREEKKAAHK